eukprot:gnl/MRDRNA2_/MRDRNA2_100948_c0_seq1.p1 gnl/MRDRNA2_/MRDRNA2_100948_c0~~gnl/MRDRNA2_/MRDRNA2_100948_c0_seq1.p1  ORF type:complete len:147 (-),score=45.73 gnl/MRDRNA2_/MRDRNA2_100948_c0_seq1:18-458(-)
MAKVSEKVEALKQIPLAQRSLSQLVFAQNQEESTQSYLLPAEDRLPFALGQNPPSGSAGGRDAKKRRMMELELKSRGEGRTAQSSDADRSQLNERDKMKDDKDKQKRKKDKKEKKKLKKLLKALKSKKSKKQKTASSSSSTASSKH